MIKLRLAALVSAMLLTSPVLAGEIARTIEWEDLVPKMEPLEDPFKTLTTDQRTDLQTLFWIRDTQQQKLNFADDDTLKDAVKRRRRLTRQGLDVDRLMAAVDRFEQEIAKRNHATNSSLDGKMVRIPGYALPMEHIDTGVKELLLVPYVGACIHVPPPPANQTIYVTLEDAYVARNLYEPVWITGRMHIKSTSKALSFVDGSADILTAYSLEGIKVRLYRK